MIFKIRSNNPKVEILVLSFNNFQITKKCLENLYTNTSVDFGLVWIDNGSTDTTSKYLTEFSQAHDLLLLRANSELFENNHSIFR